MSEYINQYIDAVLANDEKRMKEIERDLRGLGMDTYTLDGIIFEMKALESEFEKLPDSLITFVVEEGGIKNEA